MSSSWQDREATSRGLSRDVNERIAEIPDGLKRFQRLTFVCECGNQDCRCAVELSPREYEAVRSRGRRFVIAPDHEDPTVELVVHQTARYAVAETFVGEASRIPEDTDPRAHRKLSPAA
jgi:hypothetical protein